MRSEEGAGSAFWVQLPFIVTSDPYRSATAQTVTSMRRLIILLADDLEMNAEIASTILRKAGHDVDIVSDGEAAVRAAAAKKYDLVLMDIQMPGMDGFAATKVIRNLPTEMASVPIIAMTANVMSQQVEAFSAAGMAGYVGKPFRPQQLLLEVCRVADGALASIEACNAAVRVFDEQTFRELADLVGAGKVGTFCRAMVASLRSIEGSRVADPELAEMVHKLISMAGMLGFSALAESAGKLEGALSTGLGAELAFQTLMAQVTQASARLSRLA